MEDMWKYFETALWDLQGGILEDLGDCPWGTLGITIRSYMGFAKGFEDPWKHCEKIYGICGGCLEDLGGPLEDLWNYYRTIIWDL